MSDTQDGFRDIPWNRVFTGGGTAAFYASLVVFVALCVFVTDRDLAFDASRPFPWWQEKSESTTSGDEPDRPATAKDIAALEKTLAEAGHKQFTVWSALVQFADVVSLSLLCYFGSRRYHFLKREVADEAKRTRALSGSDFNGQSPSVRVPSLVFRGVFLGLPVLASGYYAVLMRNEYLPAVLVLTLAAIFLAAEHFSALAATERDLEKAADKLQELADLEDGDEWRKEVYKKLAHGAGKGWIGRIGYWDMDEEFLEGVSKALRETEGYEIDKHLSYSSYWEACVNALARYIAACEQTTDESHHSLPSALKMAIAKASARGPGSDTAGSSATVRLSDSDRYGAVRLIYRSPKTDVFFDPRQSREVALVTTKALRDLMGLMFYLLVFEIYNRRGAEAQRLRDPLKPLDSPGLSTYLHRAGFAKVRVGLSIPWVHVVDDEVYEVFDRTHGDNSGDGREPRHGRTLVRRITQNAGPRWVSAVNMLPAHHRNSLRRDFDKSGRAHAYVASLLREYGMTYGSISGPSQTEGAGTDPGPFFRAISGKVRTCIDQIRWFAQRNGGQHVFADVFLLLAVGFVQMADNPERFVAEINRRIPSQVGDDSNSSSNPTVGGICANGNEKLLLEILA